MRNFRMGDCYRADQLFHLRFQFVHERRCIGRLKLPAAHAVPIKGVMHAQGRVAQIFETIAAGRAGQPMHQGKQLLQSRGILRGGAHPLPCAFQHHALVGHGVAIPVLQD